MWFFFVRYFATVIPGQAISRLLLLYTRHTEIQMLAHRQGKVDAIYYNDVQTALKRINFEIRLQIPKLKHLDLILQKDAWIVVDKVLNDMPVLTWTNFEIEHRESLHEPVKCEVWFFHYAASVIMNRTLEAMDMMLGEELLADTEDEEVSSAVVLEFNTTQNKDDKSD